MPDTSNFLQGYRTTPMSTPGVQSPYFGSLEVFQAASDEAFNVNLTTTGYRLSKWLTLGKSGSGYMLDQPLFEELAEQDGLKGYLNWEQIPGGKINADQYAYLSKWAREQQRNEYILRSGTRNFGDQMVSFFGSLGGSITDPIELATWFVPALRVETYALKRSIAQTMKLSVPEMMAMKKLAPKQFARVVNRVQAQNVKAKPFSVFKRGMKYGFAEAAIREPFLYSANTYLPHEHYTLLDSAMNLGVSTLFSGTIHTGISLYGKGRFKGILEEAMEGETLLPKRDVELIDKFNQRYDAFMEIMERIEVGQQARNALPHIKAQRVMAKWDELEGRVEFEKRHPKFFTEIALEVWRDKPEKVRATITELNELYLKKGKKAVEKRINELESEHTEGSPAGAAARAWRDDARLFNTEFGGDPSLLPAYKGPSPADKKNEAFIDKELGRDINQAANEGMVDKMRMVSRVPNRPEARVRLGTTEEGLLYNVDADTGDMLINKPGEGTMVVPKSVYELFPISANDLLVGSKELLPIILGEEWGSWGPIPDKLYIEERQHFLALTDLKKWLDQWFPGMYEDVMGDIWLDIKKIRNSLGWTKKPYEIFGPAIHDLEKKHGRITKPPTVEAVLRAMDDNELWEYELVAKNLILKYGSPQALQELVFSVGDSFGYRAANRVGIHRRMAVKGKRINSEGDTFAFADTLIHEALHSVSSQHIDKYVVPGVLRLVRDEGIEAFFEASHWASMEDFTKMTGIESPGIASLKRTLQKYLDIQTGKKGTPITGENLGRLFQEITPAQRKALLADPALVDELSEVLTLFPWRLYKKVALEEGDYNPSVFTKKLFDQAKKEGIDVPQALYDWAGVWGAVRQTFADYYNNPEMQSKHGAWIADAQQRIAYNLKDLDEFAAAYTEPKFNELLDRLTEFGKDKSPYLGNLRERYEAGLKGIIQVHGHKQGFLQFRQKLGVRQSLHDALTAWNNKSSGLEAWNQRINESLVYERLYERSKAPGEDVIVGVDAESRKLAKAQIEQEKALAAIHKQVFGTEVRFLDVALARELETKGLNFRRHAGTLFVMRQDTYNMAKTAGHEFGHALFFTDPNLYNRLVDVLQQYDHDGAYFDTMWHNTRVSQGMEEFDKLPFGKQVQEVVNNILGEVHGRKDFWGYLKENVDQSTYDKFMRFLKDFWDRLVRGLDRIRRDSPDPLERDIYLNQYIFNVKGLVQDIAEVLQSHNKAFDLDTIKTPQEAMADLTAKFPKDKPVELKRQVQAFDKRVEQEANIVELSLGQDVGLYVDPMETIAPDPVIRKKSEIKDVRAFAVGTVSSKVDMAGVKAQWQSLQKQMHRYRKFVGKFLGDTRAKVKQLDKELSNIAEPNSAQARVLKDRIASQKAIAKALSHAYAKEMAGLQAKQAKLDELFDSMKIIIADMGDEWHISRVIDREPKVKYLTDLDQLADIREHFATGGLQYGTLPTSEGRVGWFDPSVPPKDRHFLSAKEVAEAEARIYYDDPIGRAMLEYDPDRAPTQSERNLDIDTYKILQEANSVHDRPFDDLIFVEGDIRHASADVVRQMNEEVGLSRSRWLGDVARRGKNAVDDHKGIVKDFVDESWRLMRNRFKNPQNVDEQVFINVRREASQLQGYTRQTHYKELLQDNFTKPMQELVLGDELRAWEDGKMLTVVDAERMQEVLKALTPEDRRFYTELQAMHQSLGRRANDMFNMKYSLPEVTFLDKYSGSIKYDRYSLDELKSMYREGRRALLQYEQAKLDGEKVGSFEKYFFDQLKDRAFKQISGRMLDELAVRRWVVPGKSHKHYKTRIKWMLSSMDGIFRKGLDPENTPPALLNIMRAREVHDSNPLVQVLAKHQVWDEFVAPNSELARRVWAYIETQDQRFIADRPEVREIAEVIKNSDKAQVFHLNVLGADITYREDYTISVNHNAHLMRKVGFEQWSRMTHKLLDWDQTFDRMGVEKSAQARTYQRKMDYLKAVYDDVLDNRYRDLDNPMDEYVAKLAKEPSHARTMVFLPGGVWQYDLDFGSGAPAHALLEQTVRRAELIELMKAFGPEPRKAWARIKNDLRVPRGDLDTQQADMLFDYLTGLMDNPQNRRVAEFGQLARTYANAVFLGNAGISGMVDTVHSMDAIQYLGIDLGTLNKKYWQSLRRAYNRNREGTMAAQMRAMGAGFDSLTGAAMRRVSGELPGSKLIRQSGELIFSLNGLNFWTTIAQEAMIDVVTRNVHHMLRDQHFTKNLRRYGMTDYDFRVLEKAAAKIEDIDGPVVKVVPDQVEKLDPEVARKYRIFLDDWMRQSVLEPDATSQIIGRFGTRAGTPLGDSVRILTQYLPFGLSVYNKTYRRMLNGYGEQGMGAILTDPSRRRVINMMSFAAWSMAIGYASMNIKEILRGREPVVPFINMNNNNVRKWIFQSGVAGPLADLLWARDVDDLGGVMAGPFFGGVGEIGGELLEFDLGGAVYDAERFFPGATLPIIGEFRRQVFGFALGDSLYESNERMFNSFDQKSLLGNNPE